MLLEVLQIIYLEVCMIISFIKEIKNFYSEIYETNLKILSLEELQAIQNRYKSFYSNPILLKKDSYEDAVKTLQELRMNIVTTI